MTPLEYFFIIAPVITGYAASVICGVDDTAGKEVKFRPPGWVFSIMWPVLYILLGLSWVYASRVNPMNSIPYTILVLLLTSWIVTYSCAGNKKMGVFVILGALMTALMCMSIGNAISRVMVAPLVGWLVFAMMMNAIEIQEME